MCVCVCALVQERVRPLLSQYTRHKMRSVIFIPLRHQTYHLLTTRSSFRASSLRESISLMCLHLPFDNLHQTLLQIYRIELKVLEMINDLGTFMKCPRERICLIFEDLISDTYLLINFFFNSENLIFHEE